MDDLSLRLAALGHPMRLALWRHLGAQDAPQSAGALARALGVKPSTLSMYLRKLTDAGLISCTAQGTSRLFALRDGAARAMLADLADTAPPARRLPVRVRFVCREGGARSRFAAALLARIGRPRFAASAGGLHPPRPDPLANQVLASRGHPLSRLGDAMSPDVVIRLTRTPGPQATQSGPIVLHWTVGAPRGDGVAGALTELSALYDHLAARIADLAALEVEALDDAAIRAALLSVSDGSGKGFEREMSRNRREVPAKRLERQ